MTVQEFLAYEARRPFVWGVHDCCLRLSDWVMTQGLPDAAAHLRGRYASEIGCARLLKRLGGILNVVEACAMGAGLRRAEGQLPGDVGVVTVATNRGPRPAGAICTGPRWSVLSEAGQLIAPMTPIAAWRL